jgi:hypothetical protein
MIKFNFRGTGKSVVSKMLKTFFDKQVVPATQSTYVWKGIQGDRKYLIRSMEGRVCRGWEGV